MHSQLTQDIRAYKFMKLLDMSSNISPACHSTGSQKNNKLEHCRCKQRQQQSAKLRLCHGKLS